MKLNVLVMLASSLLLVRAWDVEFFDEDCVTSADAFNGNGDDLCEDISYTPHECFRISNMGTCELYLHTDTDACEDDESEGVYDANDENMDITTDFAWDSWSVIC